VASALLNATTTTVGDTAADIIITRTIGTTAIETGKRRSFSGHGAGRTHKDHWQRWAGGEKALTIHCLGVGCYHQAVKTFEELKLWNDMIFVEVPKHRHFVCTQCGGRNIKVMPIFPRARGTPGH
jgi:hypothetical protein